MAMSRKKTSITLGGEEGSLKGCKLREFRGGEIHQDGVEKG